MKKYISYIAYLLLSLCAINYYLFTKIFKRNFHLWIMVILSVLFLIIIFKSYNEKGAVGRISKLLKGSLLLITFLTVCAIEAGITIWWFVSGYNFKRTEIFMHIIICMVVLSIIFWVGMIRCYLYSVQLGIRWRIIGLICGFIPVLHIIVLIKIIGVTLSEYNFESKKIKENNNRKEEKLCLTKYPILLVHGVFFRDFKHINYWGRIPQFLIDNGAVIYYGNQSSAASVDESGKELAVRIKEIVSTTGCEKVNIIAHSKGGLDSRYAITNTDAGTYVASLTTINTPHKGCIFADYLLNKIPHSVQLSLADKYNAAAKKLGDKDPDFITAVSNLTASFCEKFNKNTLDRPDVYYQSIGSNMTKANSGRFPLNFAYPMVMHFDGENDGLVAVESMKWGNNFIHLSVPFKRGISHADMIDLNHENIKDFDVREFYLNILTSLKEKDF